MDGDLTKEEEMTNRRTGVSFIVGVFALLLAVFAVQAQAADFQEEDISIGERTAKVGDYYFSCGYQESSNSYGIFTAKSSTGKRKLLDTIQIWDSGYHILTNGKTVFYTSRAKNAEKAQIKGIQVNGKNKVSFKDVAGRPRLIKYYNDTIYYLRDKDNKQNLYYQTAKAKKEKLGFSKVPANYINVVGTPYIYFISTVSGKVKVQIYDCSKNKVTKTFTKKNKSLDDDYGRGITSCVTKDNVYFSLETKNRNSSIIYRMPANGKKAPVKVKTIKCDYINKINSKNVYYTNGSKFYRYNFSSKKVYKMKRNAYWKAIE